MKRLVSMCVLSLAAVRASAQDFVYPSSVAVDAKGNVYVADKEAFAVFRFAAGSGGLTVLARFEGKPMTPLYSMSGIAVTPGGDVVADGYASAVFRVSSDGKISVLAKGDLLKNPTGVAIEPSAGVVVADPHAKALFRISQDAKVSVIHEAK